MTEQVLTFQMSCQRWVDDLLTQPDPNREAGAISEIMDLTCVQQVSEDLGADALMGYSEI